MSFITRHRKAFALIAVFSFFYLIGVGSLPLRASAATNSNQQPGAIEKVASSGTHSVKKSPLIPIIIGVVVVGAVAAVLILVVFKTKYDITGTWSGPFTNEDNNNWTANVTFTGDKKTGTVHYTNTDGGNYTGTYTVDGKDVSYTMLTPDTVNFTGVFDDRDAMSGTWINIDENYTGTWKLNRGASAALVLPAGLTEKVQSPFKKR